MFGEIVFLLLGWNKKKGEIAWKIIGIANGRGPDKADQIDMGRVE